MKLILLVATVLLIACDSQQSPMAVQQPTVQDNENCYAVFRFIRNDTSTAPVPATWKIQRIDTINAVFHATTVHDLAIMPNDTAWYKDAPGFSYSIIKSWEGPDTTIYAATADTHTIYLSMYD